VSLDAVAVDVGNVPRTATLAAAKAIKRVAEIEAMRAVGADRRVSHFGRRGKLSTRDDFDFEKASAEASVYAVPPGMWAIVSYGTVPHVIGFGRASKSGNRNYNPTRKGGRVNRRLRQPGSDTAWRTGPVFHPGTSGKNTWGKVRKRSRPLVLKIFADALHEAVGGG
jgi:hypothetical protein